MYTANLGNWAYVAIGIAAFTTMFSTTLTTLDASPRAMEKTTQLLFKKTSKFNYTFWIALLSIGTICIFLFLVSEMGLLIEIAVGIEQTYARSLATLKKNACFKRFRHCVFNWIQYLVSKHLITFI